MTDDPLEIELSDAGGTGESTIDRPCPSGTPVGAPAAGAIRTCVDSSVVDAAWTHVLASPGVEVGGVLLGQLRTDSEPYVVVKSALDARHTATTVGSLTFTHETWSDLADRIDREHSDKKIVGWYHSHPGHGIFLSSFDKFIHENFFSEPWQSAWVLDPVHRSEGLFQWAGGRISTSGYYRIGPAFPFPPAQQRPQPARIEIAREDVIPPEMAQKVLSAMPLGLRLTFKRYGMDCRITEITLQIGRGFSGKG